MKFRNIVILILFSIAAAALCVFAAGCSPTDDIYNSDTWKGAIVTFVLEGGEYKNSKNNVVYYFSLKEGESIHIGAPSDYSKKAIVRPDYSLDEWCKTKEEYEGTTTYSDPWDFKNDVVNYGDRVTLYAHWNRLVKYTYNVCYKNDAGETVIVGTYEVDEGAPFNDYSKYYEKIKNPPHEKTAMPDANKNYYFDEDDEPWDSSFRHPGGDEDTAINVYLHYIEGDYKLIYTAADLNSITDRTNVYLMNDIDFGGETFKIPETYRGIFSGNNKTVENFNINRGAQPSGNGEYLNSQLVQDSAIEGGKLLCISILGDAIGAEIKDVTFKDVAIDIKANNPQIDKVIVVPLFLRMSSNPLTGKPTTVTNVSVSGTVTVSTLHSGLNPDEDFIIVTDRMYYVKNEESSIGDDCTANLVVAEQTAETKSVDLYNEEFTRKKEF